MLNGERMSEIFLTKSEFAALQCCSPSYITKLKDMGRLVLHPDNPKLINVEATLAGLLVSADPNKAYLRRHHLETRIAKHVTPFVNNSGSALPKDEGGEGKKYWESRARREYSLANLASLQLERTRADYVERSRVLSIAKSSERLLHDALLRVPAQLATEIAAMKDPSQIESQMRSALRKVLTDHAKIGLDGLLDRSNDV